VKYFFFQNFAVYYLFFIFLLLMTFYFNFRLFVVVKKLFLIFIFFILWIRDFIKEFLKIMDCFLKKYRHLKSKILHKFHHSLFVLFMILAFW